MERRIKGKGRPDIKRGILPGPQRRQPAGAEGTPERGCPSGGGRGRNAQGPASPVPPMTCLGLGLGHRPIRRVESGWHSSPAAENVDFWKVDLGKLRSQPHWLLAFHLLPGRCSGPPRAVGLSFLIRGIGHQQLLLPGGMEQRALGRGNSCFPPSQHAHACTESLNTESKRILFIPLRRTIPSLGRDDYTTLCLFSSQGTPRVSK